MAVSWLASMRAALARRISPAGGSTVPAGGGGLVPVVREPYTGAWQRNESLTCETALANPTVFRCVSLIAGDIAKIAPPRLVVLDADGVWQETASPAFSPVLRTPNHYQTAQQFYEFWTLSRLLYGNAYLLKTRDERGVVIGLDILDPSRVIPLVAPDGSVYYQLGQNELAGLETSQTPIEAAPAREIIHDRWNCLFHPLVGISPLYACGGAAAQGNAIQQMSTAFFGSGGRPSGLLVAPTEIDQGTADRIGEKWRGLGPGQTAVVGYGMKYQEIAPSAVDSQLAEQAGAIARTIAGCFGVPISMVDSSQQPPYANSEASQLQYQSQCLQVHLVAIERALDDGLGLGAGFSNRYGTEFDIDELIWMDTATRTKAAHELIAAGALSPNEARYKYFGLGPVPGGETPYLQQQYFPLSSLNREVPAPKAIPAAPPEPEAEPEAEPVEAGD